MAMQQLIILDRDGVINHDSDEFIKSPDEWEAIPGSLESIAKLNQAGYRIVVVTNQSGLSRGLFTLDDLHQIHHKMHKLLEDVGGTIEAIFFCPHHPKEECQCRKPRPGMFQDIANRLGISLVNIPVVGDSLCDLQAAIASGAKPFLVLTGKGKQTVDEMVGFDDVPIYNDLADFVNHFLADQPA